MRSKMSSVALLRFGARIWQLFQHVVDAVVLGDPSEEKDKVKEKKKEKVEARESSELFPRKHNVDSSVFKKVSVTPCALDMSTVESPMTMSLSPEGHVSCRLNNDAGLDGKTSVPITPESSNAKTPTSDSTTPQTELVQGKEVFVCHYCDAKFRIRGYLTRHIKKHAIQKAYHCPFFNAEVPQDLRCHNSGGFSRRDTYKTHLRARHFVYPKGVKPQDRTKSSGHCSQCGQFFENTDQWVEQHIENGECKALPKGYCRNIKSERKSGKLRMIKVSTGHSRFISTAQSVVEPEVLLNKDALEAMAIVAQDTRRSDLLSKFGKNKIMMSSTAYRGIKPKKLLQSKSKTLDDLGDDLRLSTHDHASLEAPGPEYMDDETALNEISSSMNFSPRDHHVLEPVPSSSSQSSHEETVVTTKGVQPVVFNDPFSVPLDLEQCSLMNGTYVRDNTTYRKSSDELSKGGLGLKPLEMDTQRDRETYLNLYNYTFGTNI